MKKKNGSKIRVLLVDDHPVLRAGVRAYLGSRAVSVVGEASDAGEALLKARKLVPDVIVLDINLPSLDGGELARRLRQAVPGARLIAFSVHAGEEYVLRMARCGAHGYVRKDRPTAELLEAIRTVSGGGLHFPPGMTIPVPAPGPEPSPERPDSSVLTEREQEVLALLADGFTNKEVAAKLGISARTAETHREHLAHKLNILSVAGLTKYAIQRGLTSLK